MRTEGHRQLIMHPWSSEAIARVCEVSAETVRGWRKRDGNPRIPRPGPVQQALQRSLGIPITAWSQRPATVQAVAPANVPDMQGFPISGELGAVMSEHNLGTASTEVNTPQVAAIQFEGQGAYLQALSAQCERIRHDLENARRVEFGVNPTQVLKLEKAYADALERAAKADGKLSSIDEHRLAQSLTFRRHCEKVLKALRPYPEARQAVLDALRGG